MTATATFNELASRNYSALARVSRITSHLAASTRNHFVAVARIAAYERQIHRLAAALSASTVNELAADELNRLTFLVEDVLGSTSELTRLVLTISVDSNALLKDLYQRLAAGLDRACRPLAARLDALHLSLHDAENIPAARQPAFGSETRLPVCVPDQEAFATALLQEMPNEQLKAASKRHYRR